MIGSWKETQPSVLGFHLSLKDCPVTVEEREYIRKVRYASKDGSYMYVIFCTRLYICFIVGMVSQYQENSSPRH